MKREMFLRHPGVPLVTRRNREIGVEVTLSYMPHEDPSCQWQTDCTTHGFNVGHASMTVATAFLPVPWEWCSGCQAVRAGKPVISEF